MEIDIPPPPLTPEQAEEEAKMAKQRAHVLKEIIETEEAYVADLAVLEDTVLARARERRVLDDERIASLFPGLRSIRELSTVLLAQLRAGAPVGRSFARLAGFLKMYTAYCVNVPRAEALLQQHARASGAFRAFAAEVPALPGMHGLGLHDFVIKPVQRLCRYPLLLRELARCTPRAHADHADLARALDELARTLDAVNERKRADEQCSRVVRYARRLDLRDQASFITPSRRFLREAALRELLPDGSATRDTTYVFFNDLVLRVSPAASSGSSSSASSSDDDNTKLVLHSYIERAMLLVAPVPDDPRCLLDILHLGVARYTIVCASPAERDDLIDLCETIMERRRPANSIATSGTGAGGSEPVPRIHSASFSSSSSSSPSLQQQQQQQNGEITHSRRAGKTPAEQFGLAPKLKELPPVPRGDEKEDARMMVLPFTCTDGLGDDCRAVRFDRTATSWDALLARIARKVGYPPDQRMRLAVRMPAGNIVQLTSLDDLLHSVPATGRLPEFLVSREK